MRSAGRHPAGGMDVSDIVIKALRRTGKTYPPATEAMSPEDRTGSMFPGVDQEQLIRDALTSVDRAYIILSDLLERVIKLKTTSLIRGRSGESKE